MLPNRVTRLGEFSHIGCFLHWVVFKKKLQNLRKCLYYLLPKYQLGYILATFSQTHLVTLMPTVRFFRENPILSKFLRFYYFAKNIIIERPTCPGGVVIGPGNRTEDRGFESHQGVRFLGLSTLQYYVFLVTQFALSLNVCI
jgi:hypothetical protein